MANPSMTGPLTANAKPMSFEAGDFGTIYVTGAISGLGLFQSDPGVAGVGDHADHVDLSNGQLIVQKTDGLVQFFAEVGAYSFPSLGTPYFQSGRATGFYTPFSTGYIKLAPTDTFSVQAGKLPTLIGAEYAFTFQNMNIERGLLWNQEPVFSRGVQGNYTAGPVAFSLSLNDGFYSGNYDWVSGSAAWTIDKVNTLSVVGGGNFDRTTRNTLATPLAQDNSKILNVIYTYNNAPWTITPYFQYTSVDSNPTLGLPRAETWGGAILANYQINDNVNVAGRAEYISSSGPGNLLYGPGSSAASFTITPTWQDGIYFMRGDASVVQAFSTTPGLVFGKFGNTRTQARWVLEGGIIF
ncbi:MAG: porin [Alphaproteobacteria bacterium]|nr:porin [Alphaproteobacteria bacterium]